MCQGYVYTASVLTCDVASFDEVHFGKFASYYITREYYFDVHPPFAKLLFGLAGWFVGYDGSFGFENIGDSYTEAHVPYVGMRALPAILGSLTVPIVYAIMKECGYSTIVATFSASIVLFGTCHIVLSRAPSPLTFPRADNAHIAQDRLILLDATLIFFMSLTMYSYIRWRKLRYMYVIPRLLRNHALTVISAGTSRGTGGFGSSLLGLLWPSLGPQKSMVS